MADSEEKMDTSEPEETEQDRALAYRFLAGIYGNEVSTAFLESLRDSTDSVPPAFEPFVASLSGADEAALEKARVELANDFVRLFDSMGPDPIWVFESPYSNGQEMLMQQARDEVLRAYREEGLDKAKDFRYPEDHISSELEFMAILCEKRAMALVATCDAKADGYLMKQRSFLNDHLLTWVPKMCDKIDRRARTEFYRAVSKLTRELLESDKAYLQEEAAR